MSLPETVDVTVAYRQTSLREYLPTYIPSPRPHYTPKGAYANQDQQTGCIEYLRRFGYSDYQSYLLMSCAPIQGHVAGIVDIPNACTTMGLPMDIFDFDISPSASAAAVREKLDMGSCAFETGVTEGVVAAGGGNSEHSFGGGLTYKD